MSGKLILNVMDLDNVKDEQAGALIFDFKDLLSREQKSFFWANIYGAPGQEEVKLIDSTGDEADEMNKDPTKATCWKGRILIGIEHEESESPKLGVDSKLCLERPKDEEGNEIEGAPTIAEMALEFTKLRKYRMMYEFNSCLNCPKPLGKYNLQLSIAELKWTSDGGDRARAVGYNYNRWNQRSGEIEFELPYSRLEDMDDIFLYLCPDKGGLGGIFGGGKEGPKVDKPVSYVKMKACDF